jgi:cytoskeleton protein RodZ
MAAEAGGDVRAGIGTRLKAAREKKGLTILQAAEKMHVDPRILESLEVENFAALGAAVYVKGHMRHYAELIGEQPAELQELYAAATRAAPVQPDLTRISRMQPDTDVTKLAGPAVVALVAIAAIGALWWLVSAPSEKPLPTVVQETAQSGEGTVSGPEAAGAEASSPVSVGSQAAAPQGSQRNQHTAGGQPGSAGGKVTKTSPVSTNTAATATPAVAKAVTGSTPAGAAPPAPPPTRARNGQLTLKFSSDSWAEVYDASGERLFYDVGAASSAHTVKGPVPMRVVLGNASGVALEYNGRPAPIPSAVMPDGSVRFVINAHGRAVRAAEGN